MRRANSPPMPGFIATGGKLSAAMAPPFQPSHRATGKRQTMNSMHKKVRRTENAIACELSDEIAILDLERGLYFGLNDVGAVVWNKLSAPASVRELCEAVSAEFDVSADACQPDIEALLDSLRDASLVEDVDQA